MTRLIGICAAVLSVAVAVAATGWAGRNVFTFNVSGSYRQAEATALRLTAVNVRYDAPYTGTLYIYTRLSGTQALRYQAAITAARSVVFEPGSLWLKNGDSVTVSNSAAAAASTVVDLAYD